MLGLDPDEAPEDYIQYAYPGLFPLICSDKGDLFLHKKDEYRRYSQDPEQASMYIHGWLLPKLGSLRQDKKLR